MHSLLALTLALSAGCLALPVSNAPSSLVLATDGATLKLVLPATASSARKTQAQTLGDDSRLRLTVAAGDLSATMSTMVANAADARTVQVRHLPPGRNRLLKIQALDASDRPLPGAEWLAVTTLATGSNEVTLSPAVSATARAWERWLATGQRTLAQTADPALVMRRLEALKRDGAVAHHALLDVAGWADAVAAASGSLDVPGTFAIPPATALIRVTGAPSTVPADLWIDDPVSPQQRGISPVTTQTDGRYRVGPILPGSWTAWVSVPGFGIASRSLSVAAGENAVVDVAFKGWEAGPKLPVAVGNAGYTTDGRHLYVIGGTLQGGASTSACWKLDTAQASPSWQALPAMPSARDGAATALVGTRLYVVGGYTKGEGYRSDAIALDLAAAQPAWEALTGMSTINGKTLSQLGYPAGAFALDGKLTVLINAFGDQVAEAPFDRSHTAQYNPQTHSWAIDANGVPTIRTPRVRAGFANVDVQGVSSLFVAGGDKPDIQENRGSFGFLFRSAMPRVEALDLVRKQWAGWADLPTSRSELAIAQAGDSLYAAGGVDSQEHALDTVECLDLLARRWRPGPPLKTPRSSFGLLSAGGRLWAIGGAPSLFLNDAVGSSARVFDTVEVLNLEATP